MRSKVLTVALDILSILLVLLPWIVLQLGAKTGSITPYRRGFFCNDDSIKYPYLRNTVSNEALWSTSYILPFVFFVIIEAIHCRRDSDTDLPYSNSRDTSKFPWRKYVMTVYSIYLMFLFGLAIEQTLTNIGKFSIGRLRPHFLDACRPDMSRLNCTTLMDIEQRTSLYGYVMINDSDCNPTNETKKKLMDARLSFPSGHSSTSTYVAVFVSLYLQARFTWKGSRLLRHFLQAGLIYLAFYVSLSRVSDYKHHWSDVLFGAIIGISVASITCIHILNKYRKQAMESSSSLAVQERSNV